MWSARNRLKLNIGLGVGLFFLVAVQCYAQNSIIREVNESPCARSGYKGVSKTKLTVRCPYYNTETSDYDGNHSTYTIHVTDLATVDENCTVRTHGHGFYSFKQRKWIDFGHVDSSYIYLTYKEYKYLKFNSGGSREVLMSNAYGSIRDPLRTETCAVLEQKINRTTLEIEVIFRPVAFSNDYGPARRGDYYACVPDGTEVDDRIRIKPVHNIAQCTLLPYTEPGGSGQGGF